MKYTLGIPEDSEVTNETNLLQTGLSQEENVLACKFQHG